MWGFESKKKTAFYRFVFILFISIILPGIAGADIQTKVNSSDPMVSGLDQIIVNSSNEVLPIDLNSSNNLSEEVIPNWGNFVVNLDSGVNLVDPLLPQFRYINATAAEGGSIAPVGEVSVINGQNQAFVITPLPGFTIGDVVINNSLSLGFQDSPYQYLFTNVTMNQSIDVTFTHQANQTMINGSENISNTSDSSINTSSPGLEVIGIEEKQKSPEYTNQSPIVQATSGPLGNNETGMNTSVEAQVFQNISTITGEQINETGSNASLDQVHVDMNASPRSGIAPLPVTFRDLSTGSPSSWYWEFGDGVNTTIQNPEHTYQVPGVYVVSLKAMNEKSSGYGVWDQYITVTEAPAPMRLPKEIIPNLSVNRTSGNAPLLVSFSDLSAGNATSWLWDFGDNSTSNEQNPIHEYVSPGMYQVSLFTNNSIFSGSLIKPKLIVVR